MDLKVGKWVDSTWGDVSVGMVVRDLYRVAEVMSTQQVTPVRPALKYARLELMTLDGETGRPTGDWLRIETCVGNYVQVLV